MHTYIHGCSSDKQFFSCNDICNAVFNKEVVYFYATFTNRVSEICIISFFHVSYPVLWWFLSFCCYKLNLISQFLAGYSESLMPYNQIKKLDNHARLDCL